MPSAAPIYLNAAGTSWPRPPGVAEAIARAGAAPPDDWPGILDTARREIAAFFGVGDPERLMLTSGCTSALAVAIADVPWRQGDVALTSSLEHHALLRPLAKLAHPGRIGLETAPRAGDAPVDLEWVEARLRSGGVRLVAASAASNVTGELLPIDELVTLAHRHGALCLIDAAQLAGAAPLDLGALGADLVAFAGHKGPQGPQGIGGLYVAPGVALESPAATCERRGGGSEADACSPMPGWCDVGSANVAGAAGLAAGVGWLASRGPRRLRDATRALTARLLDGLEELPDVRIHGARDAERRVAVVSLSHSRLAAEVLERRLRLEHGIATRAGHHCAPQAHETLGTAAHGTLRVSFGPQNVSSDVDAFLGGLRSVLSR